MTEPERPDPQAPRTPAAPDPTDRPEVIEPRPEQPMELRAAIDAAELAAEQIRREAEQRAATHMEAARERANELTAERMRSLAALTDELIGQAATIRAHSSELAAALRRATETLTRALEGESSAPSPTTAISATGVHEDVPLESDADEGDGPEFRARQLAAAGASRRTIAIVLRREFGVEPLPVLEKVLG